MWNNELPARVAGSVASLVTRLRRPLGVGAIQTVRGGYQLRTTPELVDALRFRSLLTEAATSADTERERSLLDAALQLWRAEPFAGLRSEVLERDELPGLVELRLAALERRADMDLAAGTPLPWIAQFHYLTAQHPLRESLWQRLIMALAASGRQADALMAYEQVRTTLRENLGVSPGAELQRLHQRLVSGAPTVTPPPVEVPQVEPLRQLPPAGGHFVGREAALVALDDLVAARAPEPWAGPAIAVIDSGGGMGKTTLAIHWAHRVRADFPDAQVYLDLRGYSPGKSLSPHDALELALRALGIAGDHLPATVEGLSALLRTVTADKRILLILDNVRNSEQVRPLLPGPGGAVVVTSRSQLRGLVARDGAVRVSLDRLAPAESVRLLTDIVGARAADEPERAADIAQLCDHTPLALRIIADRLSRQSSTSLGTLVHALQAQESVLDAFDTGDDDSTNLRIVLSWSYEQLDPAAARALRLIGLFPGASISLSAAAAMVRAPAKDVRVVLDRLTDTHLLEQKEHDRYELHDLVRAFAEERSLAHDSQPHRAEAVVRVLEWYVRGLNMVYRQLEPSRQRVGVESASILVTPPALADERAADVWCEAEYRTLVALVDWAVHQDQPGYACRLTWLLQIMINRSNRPQDQIDLHQIAIAAAASLDDPVLEEARLLNGLGNGFAELQRPDDAERCYQDALARFQAAGNEPGEAQVLGNLGLVDTERGKYERAKTRSQTALELYRRLGDHRGEAVNFDNLAMAHFGCREYAPPAIACWRRAFEINRRCGWRHNEGYNLANLGRAYAALNKHERAIAYFGQALLLYRLVGSRQREAITQLHLGYSLIATGDVDAAREAWRASQRTLDALGDARAGEARRALDTADAAAAMFC